MLTLTKIRREIITDHIMPSDLDKNDIKHGLQLKEKMLQEVTDDFIKSTVPNWKEIERDYRKRGVSDIMDKIACGEMTLDDIPKYNPVRCEVWLRWKKFEEGTLKKKKVVNFEGREVERWTYDFDRDEGYSEWIKEDKNHMFLLKDMEDILIQLQIVIIGDNCGRYFPYQDYTHPSGWYFVSDCLKFYDLDAFERYDDTTENAGKLSIPLENQEEFTRLFFKNRYGYSVYDWYLEDEDWLKSNYPDQEVRTLQCDPFRMKYDYEDENGFGTVCMMSGRQWIKTKYRTEMINVALFNIKIDNLKTTRVTIENEEEEEVVSRAAPSTPSSTTYEVQPSVPEICMVTFSRNLNGVQEKPYECTRVLKDYHIEELPPVKMTPKSAPGLYFWYWKPYEPDYYTTISKDTNFVAYFKKGKPPEDLIKK